MFGYCHASASTCNIDYKDSSGKTQTIDYEVRPHSVRRSMALMGRWLLCACYSAACMACPAPQRALQRQPARLPHCLWRTHI